TITGDSSLRKSRRMTQSSCDFLAVVPIFVNAGSALLPAIIAPVVSGVALLFKPRELLAVCRSRPVAAIEGLLGVGLGVAGGVWLVRGNPAAARERRVDKPERGRLEIDWNAEAIRILNGQEPLGLNNSTLGVTTKAAREGPLVFRGDYSRCGYDGS